jgi:hypothetical protein
MDDQDWRRDCVTCTVAAPWTWPRRHAFSLFPFGGILQTSAASLKLPEAYFTCIFSFSPLILLTVGGGGVEGHGAPKRGVRWFVALRCYAEKCAFFLSTEAQGHVELVL